MTDSHSNDDLFLYWPLTSTHLRKAAAFETTFWWVIMAPLGSPVGNRRWKDPLANRQPLALKYEATFSEFCSREPGASPATVSVWMVHDSVYEWVMPPEALLLTALYLHTGLSHSSDSNTVGKENPSYSSPPRAVFMLKTLDLTILSSYHLTNWAECITGHIKSY